MIDKVDINKMSDKNSKQELAITAKKEEDLSEWYTQVIQKSDLNTNLIVNISEDGWFGNSIGPYQHFSKTIFRSIEQNSFLIRSANKGISAIIDNKGNVIKKLSPNEAGNIQLEVPLIKNENKNKNDLIFFALLITYILIFLLLKKNDN